MGGPHTPTVVTTLTATAAVVEGPWPEPLTPPGRAPSLEGKANPHQILKTHPTT